MDAVASSENGGLLGYMSESSYGFLKSRSLEVTNTDGKSASQVSGGTTMGRCLGNPLTQKVRWAPYTPVPQPNWWTRTGTAP
mgnify:CR=1 FL=1